MNSPDNVCPFTFRANPCDSIESPPAEHWTARLYGACPEGIRAAAAYDTPEAAWAGIDRPDFLVWAVDELSDAPDVRDTTRLAYLVAKSVEELYSDDDATEVLNTIERWLGGEGVDANELRTMLECVYAASIRANGHRRGCLTFVRQDEHGAGTHARAAMAHNHEMEALRATFCAGHVLLHALRDNGRSALADCSAVMQHAVNARSDAKEAERMNLTEHLDDHAAALGGAPVADNLDAIKAMADLVREHLPRPTMLDEQD